MISVEFFFKEDSSYRYLSIHNQQDTFNKAYKLNKWLQYAKILMKELAIDEKSFLFNRSLVYNSMQKAKYIISNQSSKGLILNHFEFKRFDHITPIKFITPSISVVASVLSQVLGICACVDFLQNNYEFRRYDSFVDLQKSLILDPASLHSRAILEFLSLE